MLQQAQVAKNINLHVTDHINSYIYSRNICCEYAELPNAQRVELLDRV